MKRTLMLVTGAALSVGLAVFGAWFASLPASVAATAAVPVSSREQQSILSALTPPDAKRPVVAVIGINDATETTDYLMATGILRRADVADVVLVATEPGPVRLYPALRVEPDLSIAEFDVRHAAGADYVIVPAMRSDDDPAVMAWLRAQARKGARIIGVCAGAKVVGAAGLLEGRRATTHWYFRDELLRDNPSVTYVKDRRIVVDGPVTTTTGITASIPMALTLVEAIAGRAKAEETARDLGVGSWGIGHSSDAFQLTRGFAATVIGNGGAVWDHETLGLQLTEGIDEVSLALVADAWSRTYRSSVRTIARTKNPVRTANGLRILPDEAGSSNIGDQLVSSLAARKPADALDASLAAIDHRYGAATRQVVAMQLEYPQPPLDRSRATVARTLP